MPPITVHFSRYITARLNKFLSLADEQGQHKLISANAKALG